MLFLEVLIPMRPTEPATGSLLRMQSKSLRPLVLAPIRADDLGTCPKNAKKPDNIIEKMVEGKIKKFYEQNCLLQQEFVKNGDLKVEEYLTSKGVKLINYVRFEKGEGLAKKEENFADEVASMIK